MASSRSRNGTGEGEHCKHGRLYLEPSPHATEVGYEQASEAQRITATTKTGKITDQTAKAPPSTTFPAPLVLPGDDLAYDPKYENQSLHYYITSKHRNPVTPRRKTLYIIPPPTVDPSVSFIHPWTQPSGLSSPTPVPKAADITTYLRAFYTGLTVKLSPFTYKFTSWDSTSKPGHPSPFIALTTRSSSTRIRTRPTPSFEEESPPPFSHQLSLEDLLDALIEDLPRDAYAVVMLLQHDLYESEDDDFCMGRAYGGSRVCVVSMGRYDPGLDGGQGVDGVHGWPGSHCGEFVESVCGGRNGRKRKRGVAQRKGKGKGKGREKVETIDLTVSDDDDGEGVESEGRVEIGRQPIRAAVEAYRNCYKPVAECSTKELEAVWLNRVCRTASHELGHCFGLDHCVYYACNMQSTASLAEDARQPPYLCPVDVAKLGFATGVGEKERLEALREVCGKWKGVAPWEAMRAWVQGRLKEIGA
ncbi:MAG: Archaemetzincin-1 [Bogoriella megaspora]|nr:MAG: Archaemetzincin-1 [Bogoriella megaspora]